MSHPNLLAFRGRRAVILGAGRQGLALARFLVRAGAQVTLSDRAPASQHGRAREALGDLPIRWVLGGHPLDLLEGCDLLCLSGGVPLQSPLVQAALERGIPLTNDSLLTLQLAPCPVVAITGSSGKTTTTTLVGQMLAHGRQRGRVHIGGNIGTPLLDRLDRVGPEDLLVLELSSFQLELWDPALAAQELQGLGPQVAAILNVTPNHLDRHGNMADYTNAKLNLLRHLQPTSQVVLNRDDPVTARLAGVPEVAPPPAWEVTPHLDRLRDRLVAQGIRPLLFSRGHSLDRGAWLEGETLLVQGHPFARRDQILLRGDHNLANLLAAAAIATTAGASLEGVRHVAQSFRGVPHRLEEVAHQDGVTWINDSIATAPERTVAALRSFEPGSQTLVLLVGGRDKKLPWTEFADEALERVQFLIGFGEAGPMIVEKVQERAQERGRRAPECAVVRRLEDAVRLAARIVGPNTVVLLSPGGTSFDAYRDFEERGEHFRRLVQEVTARRPTVTSLG